MDIRNLISDFKPHKIGFKKVLGDLEAEVMKIMWQADRATVREVHERINLEKDLAYTTVMTIMSRLADKGLLNKESQGNAFVYTPAIGEQDFAAKVVTEVLDGLLDEFAEPAISHIVDRLGSESSGRLSKLEEVIKERRSKGGR